MITKTHTACHKQKALFGLGRRPENLVAHTHKNFRMPVITPWLPEHEVPRGRLSENLVRAWTEHELISKHVRLYREMKQMIGELVGILKHQKVTVELFETYCHRTGKGLPKAALDDDNKRNGIVLCVKGEVKRYRGFHKRKMDRFKKFIMTLKTYLREWQVLRKDVQNRLVSDFDWERQDIPNQVTLAMHYSHPKWEKCNRCIAEQMQQKYDYARVKFDSEEERNEWICAYEVRMGKNLSEGVTDSIDVLFELQDEYFGPERTNYTMHQQAGGVVSITEIGDDGLPKDVHFDVENIDVDAVDLVDMF